MVSQPEKKRKLKTLLCTLNPEHYSREEVLVLVIGIQRYFIPTRAAELPLPYRPYIKNNVLELAMVLVTDGSGEIQDFIRFVLHPKLNVTEVYSGRLCCGSLVLLKRYVLRPQHLPRIPEFYFEICDVKVKKFAQHDIPFQWNYDLPTTAKLFAVMQTKPPCFSYAVPLNFWATSVPKFPSRTLHSNEIVSPTEEEISTAMSRRNLVKINSSWRTDPVASQPLVVRVFTKSKTRYYIPSSEYRSFPTQTSLIVYDSTGSCSVLIWDNAVSSKVLDQIHEGSAIYLKSYNIRADMNTSKWFATIPGTMLPRFKFELHVQDESKSEKFNLLLINNVLVEKYELSSLPSFLRAFEDLANVITLEADTFVHVAGVVVGISRFSRMRPRLSKGLHTMFTVRWIEIWEPSTNHRISIEVFVNSQLKDHEEMKVGMIFALTFLRVSYKKFTGEEPRMHLTSSQHTEIFSLQDDKNEESANDNIPHNVRLKLQSLSTEMAAKGIVPCWIGGPHPYSINCYSSKEIQELTTSVVRTVDQLNMILSKLRFWESDTLLFCGKVVEIVKCKSGRVSAAVLTQRNHSVKPQQCVCVAKTEYWDSMKSDVKLYGSKAAFLHSFPLMYNELFNRHLHDCLQFPLTDFQEIGERNERLKDEVPLIKDKHFSAVYEDFFLVTLLSEDEKAAIICIFLPDLKTKEPETFTDALLKENCVTAPPCQSPVLMHCKNGKMTSSEFENSAELLIDTKLVTVVKAHQSGPMDVEFIISSASKVHAAC